MTSEEKMDKLINALAKSGATIRGSYIERKRKQERSQTLANISQRCDESYKNNPAYGAWQ